MKLWQRYCHRTEPPPRPCLTSSLRPLVTGLQVLGAFPYTWSKAIPPLPLTFNIHLGLWTVVVKLFTAGLSYVSCVDSVQHYSPTTLGSLALMVSGLTFLAGLHVGALLLTFGSRSLAHLLHEFDLIHSEIKTKKKSLSSYLIEDKGNVVIIIITLVEIGLYSFGVYSPNENDITIKVFNSLHRMYIQTILILIFFLFKFSLSIISDILASAVEEITGDYLKNSLYMVDNTTCDAESNNSRPPSVLDPQLILKVQNLCYTIEKVNHYHNYALI